MVPLCGIMVVIIAQIKKNKERMNKINDEIESNGTKKK